MRIAFLLLLISTFVIEISAQKRNDSIEQHIIAVENNLAPQIVYGDTLPHLRLLDRMRSYRVRGLSIAVIKDFKVEWAKGYGWADSAEQRPVTSQTRFQAASISKSLNSMALLKLVQAGKIDVDKDINLYLKSWKFPYDSLSGGKIISLRNLLSHTAGLTVHGFAGYEAGLPLPGIIDILNGTKPANSPAIRSQFAPGKRFEYSGGGTTISQLILQDVTGRKYDEFLRQEVLVPMGMQNSSFTQPPPPGTKDLATAYNDGVAIPGKYHIYPEQAAAGLWTTPTDLCKYIIECQRTLEGKSGKVINTAMMKQRLTPYIDSSAGLGVFLIRKADQRYFSHNGGNEGFLCTYYGSIEGGNGVVVMINGNNFGVINELVNSVATVYGWKGFFQPRFKKVYTPPADSLRSYVGDYLMGNDTLNILPCGDKLCIQQNHDGELEMIFSSSTEFSMQEIPDLTIKVINKEGKVDALEINQAGMKIVARRL